MLPRGFQVKYLAINQFVLVIATIAGEKLVKAKGLLLDRLGGCKVNWFSQPQSMPSVSQIGYVSHICFNYRDVDVMCEFVINMHLDS